MYMCMYLLYSFKTFLLSPKIAKNKKKVKIFEIEKKIKSKSKKKDQTSAKKNKWLKKNISNDGQKYQKKKKKKKK